MWIFLHKMETLEWEKYVLFHEPPPPPPKKENGSIFKLRIFSMDIEALIPIDLPKKAIYRRR